MADVLALTDLFTRVAALLPSVTHTFGWRESARQQSDNEDRIVWVPGDEFGGLGDLRGATNPGQQPRVIATLDEAFHVKITARAAAAHADELAAYNATRLLYDDWVGAVYHASHGRTDVGVGRWLIEHSTHRHDATLVVPVTIQAIIPQLSTKRPMPVSPADATIDVVELDQTEQVST